MFSVEIIYDDGKSDPPGYTIINELIKLMHLSNCLLKYCVM